eukprot:1357890-Amorphochlora_amoeboformis.AAC.1
MSNMSLNANKQPKHRILNNPSRFLQEESKLSEKKKTYGGGRLGGKKKDAGGDEKVVDSPSKPKKGQATRVPSLSHP